MIKFTVSLTLLSFVHLFVFFPNNLCQQMWGADKMCTVIKILIPESDWCPISPLDIIPEISIKVKSIKEMINN